MNCSEVQSSVYVYLDGEFAEPESESYRKHLDGCPSCHAYVSQEASFLVGIRESLVAPKAPEALRHRIEATLAVTPLPEGAVDRAPAKERGGWGTWAGLPAAAAIALALMIVLPGAPADAEVDPEITHAVTAHHREMPSEIAGSRDRVREYLQRSVSFAVEAPLPETEMVKLLGARLTQVRGEPAVVYQYLVGKQRISVLQASSRAVSKRKRVRRIARPMRTRTTVRRLHHHEGYAVVTYETRGVTHAVVSAMPEADLMRLVPASHQEP